MKQIHVRVAGLPKSQPRPRFSRKSGVAYDPGTAKGWKEQVWYALQPYRPAAPLGVPIILDATFLMPRPKSLKDKSLRPRYVARGRNDADNLLKAVMDVCTDMSIWEDDGLVWAAHVKKMYAAEGEPPGMELTIQWREED